jgi:hypothetical protein
MDLANPNQWLIMFATNGVNEVSQSLTHSTHTYK